VAEGVAEVVAEAPTEVLTGEVEGLVGRRVKEPVGMGMVVATPVSVSGQMVVVISMDSTAVDQEVGWAETEGVAVAWVSVSGQMVVVLSSMTVTTVAELEPAVVELEPAAAAIPNWVDHW
jgi:hypothetical protein